MTRATLRYLRTSPPKVREVLGLIRGLDIESARNRLRDRERGPAREVLKLLDSAVANAESNDSLPEDELFVSLAYADQGPTLKRWRPRARGRGTRIRKRTSHVTIGVARYPDEDLERRRRAESCQPDAGAGAGRAGAARTGRGPRSRARPRPTTRTTSTRR